MYPGRCIYHFHLLIEISNFLQPSKLLLDKAVDNVTNCYTFLLTRMEYKPGLGSRVFIQDYVDASTLYNMYSVHCTVCTEYVNQPTS